MNVKQDFYEKICKPFCSFYSRKSNLKGKYHFINAEYKKNSRNLVYILAGYKPKLWEKFFKRFKEEIPADFDVILLSSGRYVKGLHDYANDNQWCYLWTHQNLISNTQNIAISQFPKAKVIWKFDEDMFLCKNYFKIICETKERAVRELNYEVGFIGPLIPINTYGYVRFLKKCNKLDEYEKRFGKAIAGSYYESRSRNLYSVEVQLFLWEVMGNFDEKAEEFNTGKHSYSICPGKFSIGAIMFTRKIWEDMGGYRKDRYACDGSDETNIHEYCMKKSKVIICAEDALAAHFSWGGAYSEMITYYDANKIRI